MAFHTEYRILIDGQTQAGANSIFEIGRYVYQYAADGDLVVQEKTGAKGRWKTVLTVPQFENEGQTDD
jgi:hypothetical protein